MKRKQRKSAPAAAPTIDRETPMRIKAAADSINAALKPLPEIDRARALAAAAIMLGHYGVATDLIRAIVKTPRES